MSKILNIAAIVCALFMMSVGAMAQIRDPNIPAGTAGSILQGTPSGTSVGSLAPRTVPPLGYQRPVTTGRSSACTVGCAPIILRRHHHE